MSAGRRLCRNVSVRFRFVMCLAVTRGVDGVLAVVAHSRADRLVGGAAAALGMFYIMCKQCGGSGGGGGASTTVEARFKCGVRDCSNV